MKTGSQTKTESLDSGVLPAVTITAILVAGIAFSLVLVLAL